MKKISIVLCAVIALAAVGCESSNGGGKGGDSSDNFTVTEVCKQQRSAKRGLSGAFQMWKVDIPLVAPGVGWFYNWSNSCPDSNLVEMLCTYNMHFLPMIWNNNYNTNDIVAYKKLDPTSQYLLAYNEPNLTDQANMTPAQAAEHWEGVKSAASQSGLKLISPALNYGTLSGYNDPVKWLDEFLEQPQVSADDFVAIALHCYMSNASGLRSFVHKFDKYGKPVYMTEFCRATGSITNNETQQRQYMCDALNYMECDDAVAGYSWFMTRASGDWAAVSILNRNANNIALTDLGKCYVYFSSFDRSTWYNAGEAIPAEHYVTTSVSATAASGVLGGAPRVKSSADGTNSLLDLTDFSTNGSWVEYQIELEKTRSYDLAIRYIADLNYGIYNFSIDNVNLGDIEFDKGDTYKTKWVKGITLSAGRHTMRVAYVDGRTDFNWFYLK